MLRTRWTRTTELWGNAEEGWRDKSMDFAHSQTDSRHWSDADMLLPLIIRQIFLQDSLDE